MSFFGEMNGTHTLVVLYLFTAMHFCHKGFVGHQCAEPWGKLKGFESILHWRSFFMTIGFSIFRVFSRSFRSSSLIFAPSIECSSVKKKKILISIRKRISTKLLDVTLKLNKLEKLFDIMKVPFDRFLGNYFVKLFEVHKIWLILKILEVFIIFVVIRNEILVLQ